MEMLVLGAVLAYVFFNHDTTLAGAAVATPASVPPGAMPMSTNTPASATAANSGPTPVGFQQPGSDTIGDPSTVYGKGGGNGGYGGSGNGTAGGQTPSTPAPGVISGFLGLQIGKNASGGAGPGFPPRTSVDPQGSIATGGYLIGRGY